MAPTHLAQHYLTAEAEGRPLPVAIAVGVHPALMVASQMRLGFDEDELGAAGGLVGAPVELVERLMKNVQSEGLIVACKCAKLSWTTTGEILKIRFSHHTVSDHELERARTSCLALSQATAQRTFRFMQVEEKAKVAV